VQPHRAIVFDGKKAHGMSKDVVTRLFVGSLLAMAGGFILMGVAGYVGFASSAYVTEGADVVGLKSNDFAVPVVLVAILGIVAMGGGALGQFVAWIGAMLNTAQLHDKAWFLVLLLLGLFSFGFVAMVVYVVAGPDGMAAPAQRLAGAPLASAPRST
jgi:hypothetical protein